MIDFDYVKARDVGDAVNQIVRDPAARISSPEAPISST